MFPLRKRTGTVCTCVCVTVIVDLNVATVFPLILPAPYVIMSINHIVLQRALFPIPMLRDHYFLPRVAQINAILLGFDLFWTCTRSCAVTLQPREIKAFNAWQLELTKSAVSSLSVISFQLTRFYQVKTKSPPPAPLLPSLFLSLRPVSSFVTCFLLDGESCFREIVRPSPSRGAVWRR